MTGIRRATEADCAAMPAFRREMEGGAFLAELRHEAFYRHKYLDAGVAFVAVEGDRLLGVTSGVPRNVRLGNRVVRGADLGDLFVHPDARGQGLFRRLHDAVVEALAAEGVRVVTVRAGPGAAPLMLRSFGYVRLFRIAESLAALRPEDRSRLPLGQVPLLRRLLPTFRERPPLPEDGYSAEIVDPADLDAPEDTETGTVRDRDRVRARYADDPAPYRAVALRRAGKTVGAAILLTWADRGFVVDFWFAAEGGGGARRLARTALATLREDGARVVHFWSAREAASRDDGLTALRSAGLRTLRRNKVVLAKTLGEAPVALPPARDWSFRMGDTDGV